MPNNTLRKLFKGNPRFKSILLGYIVYLNSSNKYNTYNKGKY